MTEVPVHDTHWSRASCTACSALLMRC